MTKNYLFFAIYFGVSATILNLMFHRNTGGQCTYLLKQFTSMRAHSILADFNISNFMQNVISRIE